MREIKFRAWDKKKKQWVMPVGNSIAFPYAIARSKPWDKRAALFGISNADYQDEVWMQYTGLKDKNGVEIYEGDICKTTDLRMYGEPEVFQIVWDVENIAFRAKANGGTVRIHNSGKSELIQIIGNIYENPELLTV